MDSPLLAEQLSGGELYALYTNDAQIGYGLGYVKPYELGDGPYPEYAEIKTDVTEERFIAISCDWDCLPRKSAAQSVQSEAYIEIVKGDYSLLLLRKIMNGKVNTFIMDSDIYTEEIALEDEVAILENSGRMCCIYRICGFYDFDGNGCMEILTSWAAYEGFGYNIWSASDASVERIGSRSMGPG